MLSYNCICEIFLCKNELFAGIYQIGYLIISYLDMEQELGFEQMQLSPSRENNILDLYFTTYPSLVKSCYTVPGLSDYHMVVVDCDVKPRYKKQKHKIIHLQNCKLDQYQIKSKSPKYVDYPLS